MGEPSKVLVISPLKMKSNSDIEYKDWTSWQYRALFDQGLTVETAPFQSPILLHLSDKEHATTILFSHATRSEVMAISVVSWKSFRRCGENLRLAVRTPLGEQIQVLYVWNILCPFLCEHKMCCLTMYNSFFWKVKFIKSKLEKTRAFYHLMNWNAIVHLMFLLPFLWINAKLKRVPVFKYSKQRYERR